MGSKQKGPVPIMVTRPKLSVATSRLNTLNESFHASIEKKSFNLVEQHQKDVVTQLATIEELTYSMIANADESEHASLMPNSTTFCIESDEMRSKTLELSETRQRVPNQFQVTFTGDSTLNAYHCTNQGTQGTFKSKTTTACQDQFNFLTTGTLHILNSAIEAIIHNSQLVFRLGQQLSKSMQLRYQVPTQPVFPQHINQQHLKYQQFQ